MTNDGHKGNNVGLGRDETTLKGVCITPQPNRNLSYTTPLGPNSCLWDLQRSCCAFGKEVERHTTSKICSPKH